MIKNIGYLLFGMFFHLFRLFPVNEKKVFLVATHDSSEEGNVGVVAKAWKQKDESTRFIWMTRKDGIHHPVHFFIVLSYHMATAGTILQDNVFLPMAYLHFSKKVKNVQLWHGTGTIKRFGQSVNTGQLGKLEYKANQKITHLIVNSEYTKKLYKEAFGVEEDKIYVLGMPRTDCLMDESFMTKRREAFYRKYPELSDKTLILYAPTFRDEEVESPSLGLDLERLCQNLSEDTVFMLRLHPHVAKAFSEEQLNAYEGQIVNMTDYDEVSDLLFVADELITDYSSIIFEYCVLERPMIFYAYDLEEFEARGRSFYEDYRSYVPGPVFENEDDLLLHLYDNFERRRELSKDFKNESFEWLDGKATERLLEEIMPKER